MAPELWRGARGLGKRRDQPALRLLARVLALLGWNWEEAAGKGLDDFAEALEASLPAPGGPPWLEKAVAQGLCPVPAALGRRRSRQLAARIEAALGARDPRPAQPDFSSAPSADARRSFSS